MTKQVIAVHEIVLTVQPGKKATATEKAQRPQTKVIAPNTQFVPQTKELYDELKASGAIRDMAKGEKPVDFASLPIKGEELLGDPEAEVVAEAEADNGKGKKRGKKPAKDADDVL